MTHAMGFDWEFGVAVVDVPASDISPNAGVAVDDSQPWPVIGWLEAS
jgi:hypothetical protein